MDSTNDISDDIISFFVDEVSYIHEIDHNPKPEYVGRIKVYASIQFSETLDPIIDISLPAKEFLDKSARYSWEQLNCLEDHERLNSYQVSIAKMSLTRLVSNVMFYSVNYSLNCAMLFYMTFKFSDPALRVEEYIKSRRTQRVATFEELMPVLFDETIDIRFRPSRKFVVNSLSRKVFKKTTSSSGICTICLKEFNMRERVVSLPCGHKFDDSCIFKWFATNRVRVCPLCRFEMPCGNEL